MGNAPVQNVNPLHSAVDGVHTALHLGDHAPGDDALLHQLRYLSGADHMNQCLLIPGVPKQPTDIG